MFIHLTETNFKTLKLWYHQIIYLFDDINIVYE